MERTLDLARMFEELDRKPGIREQPGSICVAVPVLAAGRGMLRIQHLNLLRCQCQ